MSCLFINEHGGRFTVEPAHSNMPLYSESTQEEAIGWAKRSCPTYAFHVAVFANYQTRATPITGAVFTSVLLKR